VVETLGEVIEWHQRGLIPLGASLTSDSRCRLLQGDFFAMVAASRLDAEAGRGFHAIIVDIDHSPRHLLHPSHAGFYEPAGVRLLADQLQPGGVFALWSNDPPDEDYNVVLAEVFADVRAEIVSFYNPLQERQATNTVYVATTA
jgi:spermidine synthase